MQQIQEFLDAKVTGQNIYYPVRVVGHNPETKAWQGFRVDDAQKWALRKVMEQAGFSDVYFD